MRVLFDVDGTLIESGSASDNHPLPKTAIVELLKALAAGGHRIAVASSAGREVAAAVCVVLGIRGLVRIVDKEPDNYDLVIDDSAEGGQGLGRQLLQVRSGMLGAEVDDPWP